LFLCALFFFAVYWFPNIWMYCPLKNPVAVMRAYISEIPPWKVTRVDRWPFVYFIDQRHNVSPMIFKAISKTGSSGSCVFSMTIGSSERLAMQNLQISETAEIRIVPKWLFPPRFSDKNRFTSSRPDIVILPSPQKHINNKLNHWGGFFGVAGGN